GHARMEARRRCASGLARRSNRARGPKGGALELTLLRCRGSRLVSLLPLLHEVHQDDVPSRHVFAPNAAGRVEGPKHPLLSYLRERPVGRGVTLLLDSAGFRATW